MIGSGSFVGWYNAHPGSPAPPIVDVRSVVVIGNGNVAIDVARILGKNPAELIGSDLSPEAMSWLRAQPIETIHIVGRRSAADARFTEHELEELGTLQRARPIVVDPASLAGDGAVVNILRRFAAERREAPVTINFHFNLTPVAFLGDRHFRAVQFTSAGGRVTEVPAQFAITCIGYETCACCTVSPANGTFRNQDGKVSEGLYVVGWAKRGPSGTIPTNRAEAQLVAQKIVQEGSDSGRAGGAALRQLLEERNVCWVDHAGWRRIDMAEVARAGAERCRKKYGTVAEMLEAAQTKSSFSSSHINAE